MCLQNLLSIHSPMGPLLCSHPCCKGCTAQHFAVKRIPQLMKRVKEDDSYVKLQLSHIYCKCFLHGQRGPSRFRWVREGRRIHELAVTVVEAAVTRNGLNNTTCCVGQDRTLHHRDPTKPFEKERNCVDYFVEYGPVDLAPFVSQIFSHGRAAGRIQKPQREGFEAHLGMICPAPNVRIMFTRPSAQPN